MHSLLLRMGEPGAAFKFISALTSVLCFLFFKFFALKNKNHCLFLLWATITCLLPSLDVNAALPSCLALLPL